MYVDDLIVHSSTFTEHLQHIDTVKRIATKFMYLFEGPFWFSKILGNSAYELKDECGRVNGEFNKKQLNSTKRKRTTVK